MAHFVHTKRRYQIVKGETNKHIAFDTLLLKHRSVFRVTQFCDPFHDFRGSPVRYIELMAEKWAASHALAVEKCVNFNGTWPRAFELNL
jgi:hypothetical protein